MFHVLVAQSQRHPEEVAVGVRQLYKTLPGRHTPATERSYILLCQSQLGDDNTTKGACYE